MIPSTAPAPHGVVCVPTPHTGGTSARQNRWNVGGLVKVCRVCPARKIERMVHGSHFPKECRRRFSPSQDSPGFGNPERVWDSLFAVGLIRQPRGNGQTQ